MDHKPFGRKGSWRSLGSALGVALAFIGLPLVASVAPASAGTDSSLATPTISVLSSTTVTPTSPQTSPPSWTSTTPTLTVAGTGCDVDTNVVTYDVVIYEVSTGGSTTPVGGGPCSAGAYSFPVSLLAANPADALTGVYSLAAAEIDSSGDLGPMSTTPVTVDVTSDQLVSYGNFGGYGDFTASSNSSWDLYYYWPCPETGDQAIGCDDFENSDAPTLAPGDPSYQAPETPGYWFPTNPCPDGAGTIELEYSGNTGVTDQPLGYDNNTNFVELNSNCVNGITQTIATVPGVQYTLTFAYASRSPPTTGAPTTPSTWTGAARPSRPTSAPHQPPGSRPPTRSPPPRRAPCCRSSTKTLRIPTRSAASYRPSRWYPLRP